MIIIYEKRDLSQRGKDRCYGIARNTPTRNDIDPDLIGAEASAETVYVTNHDNTVVQIKGRNQPVDPYPMIISLQRRLSSDF